MPQRVLQLKEGLENGLSYDFVFLSIFLLGKFLSSRNTAFNKKYELQCNKKKVRTKLIFIHTLSDSRQNNCITMLV